MVTEQTQITPPADRDSLTSKVEQWYLEKSGRRLGYPPTEKISVIEVANFPSLGRLTVLRFLSTW